MKARPILFSAPMIRAILEGRKFQTRRVVKPQPDLDCGILSWSKPLTKNRLYACLSYKGETPPGMFEHCEFGKVGDLLWVRETFVIECDAEYYCENMPEDDRPIKTVELEDGGYHLIPHYRATEPEPHITSDSEDDTTKWKPCIFMPRWSSRITLQIINIRVERLQDISREDAIAEGCNAEGCEIDFALNAYKNLWSSINGVKSWDSNPWVWVIEFQPYIMNIDSFMKATPDQLAEVLIKQWQKDEKPADK